MPRVHQQLCLDQIRRSLARIQKLDGAHREAAIGAVSASIDGTLVRASAGASAGSEEEVLRCTSLLVALECRLLLLVRDEVDEIAIAVLKCAASSRSTLVDLLRDSDLYPCSAFKPMVERLVRICNQRLLEDKRACRDLLGLLDLFAEAEIEAKDSVDTRIDPLAFSLAAIDVLIARVYNETGPHLLALPPLKTINAILDAYPRRLISVSSKARLLQTELYHCHQHRRQRDMFDAVYAGLGRDDQQVMPIIRIKRTRLIESTTSELNRVTQSWTRPLSGVRVSFVGEEGQDAGGLRKEWLQLIAAEITQRCAREPRALFSEQSHDGLSTAKIFGACLALAMLHQVVIDVPLPTFYFAILTVRELSHYQPTLVDMGKVDQSLANGLSKLLEWDESIDGPIHETLGWNLDDEVKGTQMVVDVSNREEFVSAFIRKRLIEEPFSALQSFHGGFRTVLVGANDLLRCFELFNANELVQLICGEELPLDVTTLRRHCRVENDGDPDTVPLLLEWFWHYISSLDGPTSVLGFYRFITANHRTSILAKDEEAFHFTIFVLDERDSTERGGPQDLPRSSTCTNTLFLPRYTSEAVLFEKFDLALTEGNNSFNLA